MFIWIWNIRSLGTPQQIVDRLKSLNCADVCIKYHDGSLGLNFKNDFIEYMPILKAQGIRVGAWGYNYFNYIDAEASLIKEALSKQADYYIFDGEGEIEGKASQTEIVLQKVRATYPNAILGYAPFPYIKYHKSYPYKVFDKYCNFATPQSYSVSIGTTLDNCLKTTLQEFQNAELKLPIYPSIESYKVGDYSPIKVFINYGVWNLDSIDFACESFLNVSPMNNPETKAIPTINFILKLQKNLNRLKITDSMGNSLIEDGINGIRTKEAVKAFQTIMGLKIDSIAGPVTQKAINQILEKPLDGIIFPHYEYASRYIQWRVRALIDGVYGNATATAVKVWQKNNELTADGIVGAKTWMKLIG